MNSISGETNEGGYRPMQSFLLFAKKHVLKEYNNQPCNKVKTISFAYKKLHTTINHIVAAESQS